MGRVMSVSMLSFSGFSLSALPLGLLADLFGERWVLLGMGVGVMGVATFMAAVIARDAVGRPAEPVR
jgi:MFS family permease